MTGCFQCDNGTLVCRCGLITQQEGDVMDDDWKKFEPVEDIEIMLSTRDLAVLCNAAVLKGQSLQDFVFLAAWDAANVVLNKDTDQ